MSRHETRIEKLEKHVDRLGSPNRWVPYDHDAARQRVKDWIRLVGGPQTPKEAAEHGFSCVAASVASRLGMSFSEFKRWIKERADVAERETEWKWVDGCCYRRRRVA